METADPPERRAAPLCGRTRIPRRRLDHQQPYAGGTASAQATLPSGASPDVFELGGTGAWSNTPTVTFQPLLGERFTKALLQPIPPAAVFELLQGGWSAGLVFNTVVGSINGLRNASSGAPPDPGFDELREALARIQRSGDIGIEVVSHESGGAVLFVIRRPTGEVQSSGDGPRVRELLGLPGDSDQFEIVYGMFPRTPTQVAVLTRSMMEIMLNLGFGIDVPAADLASGRVLPGRRQAGDAESVPLVRIRSGPEARRTPMRPCNTRGAGTGSTKTTSPASAPLRSC